MCMASPLPYRILLAQLKAIEIGQIWRVTQIESIINSDMDGVKGSLNCCLELDFVYFADTLSRFYTAETFQPCWSNRPFQTKTTRLELTCFGLHAVAAPVGIQGVPVIFYYML